MTTNKWASGVAVLVALIAIIFWWREKQECEVAKSKLDRFQREMTEGQVMLGSGESPDASNLKPKATGGPTNAKPTIANAASTDSEERAKAAIHTARKTAIAEALLMQRVRRLMNLEVNVRPKFQALGLSDEQWHRFQILSLEKIDREEEARRAGKAGKTPDEIGAAVRAAGAEVVAEMTALIGVGAYDELQRFQSQRSDPARKTVESLSSRLMFSDHPLETWQTEKLTRILRLRPSATVPGEAVSGIDNGVLNELQSVLTPPQQQAWQRMRSEDLRASEAVALAKQLELLKNPRTR